MTFIPIKKFKRNQTSQLTLKSLNRNLDSPNIRKTLYQLWAVISTLPPAGGLTCHSSENFPPINNLKDHRTENHPTVFQICEQGEWHKKSDEWCPPCPVCREKSQEQRDVGLEASNWQDYIFHPDKGAGHCTALGHPLYNIVHLHGLPGVVHCTGAGKDSGKGTQIHTPFDNRKEAFRNPISGIYLRSLKSGSQKDTTSLPCSLQHESQ